MNSKLRLFFTSVALVVLLIVAYQVWNGFKSLDSSLKATILTVSGTVTAALVAHYYTKKRELETRHFVKKAEAYDKIYSMIFTVMQKPKGEGELDLSSDDEVKKMAWEAKKGLMVWGSSESIKCLSRIEELSYAGDSEGSFAQFEQLFRILRKDLGHKDNLEVGELLSFLIIPADKEKVKRQICETLAKSET